MNLDTAFIIFFTIIGLFIISLITLTILKICYSKNPYYSSLLDKILIISAAIGITLILISVVGLVVVSIEEDLKRSNAKQVKIAIQKVENFLKFIKKSNVVKILEAEERFNGTRLVAENVDGERERMFVTDKVIYKDDIWAIEIAKNSSIIFVKRIIKDTPK